MNVIFPHRLIEQIQRTRVIAVLSIDDAADSISLARSLIAGGVNCMELTLRTDAAFSALERILAEVPEMTAGVGTVLTPEQTERAFKMGAAFGVAPGLNPRVVEHAQSLGFPFAPGVLTPSDIEKALELHCRILKFFPAEPSGGITYLKNMAAPYAHLNLQFIPLGGINQQNMHTYLSDPQILALGGSWLAPRSLIRQKQWSQITDNARQAVQLIQNFRGDIK